MKHITRYKLFESDYAKGSAELEKMERELKPDEAIWLEDDEGGENLRGFKVTKTEYLRRMLDKAIKTKNWVAVQHALTYIDTIIENKR